MKLFIDTANIEHIRIASKWGVISGATTNPSLIAKEGRQLEDVVKEIVELIDGPQKCKKRVRKKWWKKQRNWQKSIPTSLLKFL